MALTPKQLAFCREYLADPRLNATQAAIRAGYSAKTAQEQGSRLLSNVMVAAEIARQTEERKKRNELSQDYVLRHLMENLQRALTNVPVLDSEGNRTGEYRYAGSVANRAMELLGKHLGMFPDRHEFSGPNGGPIPVGLDLSLLTDDQLAALESLLAAAAVARSGAGGAVPAVAGGVHAAGVAGPEPGPGA